MAKHFSNDLETESKNKIIGIGVAAMIALGIALLFRAIRRDDFEGGLSEGSKNLLNRFNQGRKDLQKNIGNLFSKYNKEMDKANFDEIVKKVVTEYSEGKGWAEEQLEAMINKLQESWYELKM